MMPKEELAGYPFNAAALHAVCANYADGLVEAIEAVSLDFGPSEAHKKAVCNLMDNSLRKTRRHALYRRVGTIAAVFVLLFGAVMVTNAHARELFVRWVRQVFPDHVLYWFYGEPEGGLHHYTIGWIPDGAKVVRHEEDDEEELYVYHCSDSVSFVVSFYTLGAYSNLDIEDYDSIETLTINGNAATLFISSTSTNALIIIDEQKQMVIDINAQLSVDDLIRLGESIY
jgi:hypothetical protein